MSWIEKISNQIIITCGDGKSYQPSWMNASKIIEWNIADFNFPGINGTLVKKSKKLGTKYNLELFFQGDDHLDKSMEMEQSLNDSRPIVISHPFYGTITVQAPAFTIDNSGLNVSKWTGVVIETIEEINPRTDIKPIDAITIQKNLLDANLERSLTFPPTANDAKTITQKNKNAFNLTVPILKIPKEVEKYYNVFNQANAAVTSLTASPLLAMRETISLINAPMQLTLSVQQRLKVLNSTFDDLRLSVSSLTTPASKQIYQTMAGSAVSAMCMAASLPGNGDYSNNKSVFKSVDTLVIVYNLLMADLDTLQSANGGGVNSFVPDINSLQYLNQLFNLTISNLFTIALGARSERTLITETDTNIIILTHRFYGLDSNDNNINELFENNNLGLNHILQIKKGTKIVYYI